MQAKLRQKLLTLITAPTDKAFLQEMFDAGMTIKGKPDGGYTFKQSSLEIERWKKFKVIASGNKSIKSALQQLTLSLEEPVKESDAWKPAQVEADVLSNGIKTGKRQPVKEEEAPALISLFEEEKAKVYTTCSEARDYYIDENYYKVYGEVETTGTVVYGGGIKTMIEVSEKEYLWVDFREMKESIEINKGDGIKVKGLLRKKFITEIVAEKVEILATAPHS